MTSRHPFIIDENKTIHILWDSIIYTDPYFEHKYTKFLNGNFTNRIDHVLPYTRIVSIRNMMQASLSLTILYIILPMEDILVTKLIILVQVMAEHRSQQWPGRFNMDVPCKICF